MTRKQWHKLAALLITLAFLAGLFPLAPPAQAISLGGAFGDLVKLFGIGYIVKHFSNSINNAVNSLLGQHQAAIEGKTKVVPIIRVGNGGVAAGAAQVMGPAEQVDKVKAVAQLDWTPGNVVRGRILLPVSTDKELTKSIRGVSGVGISAVIVVSI